MTDERIDLTKLPALDDEGLIAEGPLKGMVPLVVGLRLDTLCGGAFLTYPDGGTRDWVKVDSYDHPHLMARPRPGDRIGMSNSPLEGVCVGVSPSDSDTVVVEWPTAAINRIPMSRFRSRQYHVIP